MSRFPALSFSHNPSFKALIESAASSDSVTIIAGAGVSIDAGLPTWPELIARLAANAGADDRTELELPRRSGLVLRGLWNDHHIPDYGAIGSALYADFSPTSKPVLAYSIATLMLRSPAQVGIVTLNYDDVIEQALRDVGFPEVHSQSLDSECADWWHSFYNPQPERANVFHLHGMIAQNHLEPVILTEDQFLKHGARVQSELKEIFGEPSSVCILVGLSLGDPNILSALSDRKAEGKANSNIFVLSVPSAEGGLTPGANLRLHERLEKYLQEVFGCHVVPLNSYSQVAQCIVELTAALDDPVQYCTTDDPDQSRRYGYRLMRGLKRAYGSLGWSKPTLPSRSELENASDLLAEELDGIRETLIRLVHALPESQSRDLQHYWNSQGKSLRDYVTEEGLALFLWLPAMFDLEDETRARDYALHFIACSAYHHHKSWSLRPPEQITEMSSSSAARAAFYGRVIPGSNDATGDLLSWRCNLSVPLTLVEPKTEWPVHAGVLTLSSKNAYEQTTSPQSAIGMLSKEGLASLAAELGQIGVRILT